MTINKEPLIDVIRKAQAGDRSAFQTLYEHHMDMVFRTAYLVLGDYGHAEEITQEVFMRVYDKLAMYCPHRGAFTTWLHRITINMCFNAKRRHQKSLSLDRAHATGMEVPTSLPSPMDKVLHLEKKQHVWQAVYRLSPKLRVVIVLRYYYDLSYAEIAQILSCPIGTVRSRLSAAHTRLNSDLEKSNELNPD